MEESDKSINRETTYEKVSKMTTILPILGVILFVVGFLKHYYYYKKFGVDIIEYIENVEIILLFLPDVINILIVSIFFFIYSELMDCFLKWQSIKLDTVDSFKEQDIKTQRKIKFRIFLLNLFFLVISYFLYHKFKNTFFTLWHAALFFQTLIIVFDMILTSDGNYKTIIYILCCSMYFTYILADYNVHELKNSLSKQSLIIKTKSKETIVTDKIFYKIGVTNKFLFLNCEPEKRIEIIKREDIEKIEVINSN